MNDNAGAVMRLFSIFFICVALINAGGTQTFKKHTIGESPEQFFAVATMAENGSQTTAYCHLYLAEPKVQKAYVKAKKNIFDLNAHSQSVDVDGCHEVQDALDGKDVEVGARYASELGSGSVTFRKSKLALMVFDLKAGTPLDDVIADISKELNGAAPVLGVDTKQNGFGATLQQRKATWATKELTVEASESRDFRYGDMGILVIVADSDYFRQKEGERQANRRNTIQ
jgi:hypothetical protein